MKIIFRSILLVSALVILAIVLLRAVDPDKTLELLADFPRMLILKLAMISIILSILKAYRFHIIIKESIEKIKLWQSFKIYFAGQAVSPLPGGAAFRLILIKKETGSHYSTAAGGLIAISFLELTSALLLAIVGSVIFDLLRGSAILATIVMIFVAFILLDHTFFQFISSVLLKIKKTRKITIKIFDSLKNVRENIVDEKKRLKFSFVKAMGIAIASHIVGGYLVYSIVTQLKVDLNFFQSIFVYVSSIVLATITGIIPGGIGPTEGGITGMLVINGTDLLTAIAVVIIFRFLTLGIYFVMGLLFLFLFYWRILLKHEKK